jgi:hypothetical protein
MNCYATHFQVFGDEMIEKTTGVFRFPFQKIFLPLPIYKVWIMKGS